MIRIYTRQILLGFCIFLVLTGVTIIHQSPVNLFTRPKFGKIHHWYDAFQVSLELNQEENFVQEVVRMTESKLAHDLNNKLWEISGFEIPTAVLIPSYYSHQKEESSIKLSRPPFQPFDPRFTLGVYFQHIANNSDVTLPFHWSDWLDMSVLDQFIIANKKPTCKEIFGRPPREKDRKAWVNVDNYCKPAKNDLGFSVIKSIGTQTITNNFIASRSFLYTTFEPPSQLVLLTNTGSLRVKVRKSAENLINNGMVDEITKTSKSKMVDCMESFIQLNSQREPFVRGPGPIAQEPMVDISKESFEFDSLKVVEELREIRKNEVPSLFSNMHDRYLNSLEQSLKRKNPPKSFFEVRLVERQFPEYASHYDWRFFSGYLSEEEINIKLHELLRTWLKFTQIHSIRSWLAHGSLLGWYWNGQQLPWDEDIDVQMPIQDLHFLAKNFNQSLIIEDTSYPDGLFKGVGRFFLDVGNSITFRELGNGNNNIDARFIDIDSGVFIDITGLSISNTQAPKRYRDKLKHGEDKYKLFQEQNQELQIYNCRNNHFISQNELSPLINTLIENIPVYVPLEYKDVLDEEYQNGGTEETNFLDYYYFKNLRMWIETQQVLDYVNNPEKYLADYSSKYVKRLVGVVEKIRLNTLSLQQHLDILNNDNLLVRFLTSEKSSRQHEKELKLLNEGDYEEAQNVVKETMSQRLNRQDSFLRKYYIGQWRWERAIMALQGLMSTMQTDPDAEIVLVEYA